MGDPVQLSFEADVMFVLYNDTTSDYPGEWVVRRQATHEGQIFKDSNLSARGKTRKECVAKLFKAFPTVFTSFVFIARSPQDDPVIAGTWL